MDFPNLKYISTNRIFHYLYSTVVSISLFLFILHIVHNEHLRIVDGIAFSLFLALGSTFPKSCIFLMLCCLTWFEHPLLLLNYPNHFLSDSIILGASIGILIRTRFSESKTLSFNILMHPLFLVFVMLTAICIFQFLGMVWHWNAMSPEGINFFSISGLVGRNIHLWNIQSNPIHNLSVAQGYLIQIQLIFIIMHFSKRYFNIKRQHLAYSLIFGSIPVFIYGILQSDLYKIISTKYTVDPGATFQNGNHLSFYSALIFILMLWITVRKSLGTFILSILVSPLALWNLYIGRGRTALVSLILAIILSHINELFIILRTIQKRFYVNFSLLISASLVCIIVSSGAYYFWNQAGFLGLNEIETLVKNHDLIGLFYAGGRKQQFLQAWMAFQENWLIGLGTGAFFNLAGLNYEIHNSVLNIAVGSGIVPAILFILAFVAYIYTILFCIYQKKTKSISHNRVWSLTIALYLLICTIPDTFLSFRSLLSVSSCIICITIYNLLEIDYFKKYRLTFKRSLIVLSLLISFLSVLALLCPPKYYRSTHAYKDRNFDKVLNKNYRWHRQDTYWNLEASQCLTGEIFPFPNSKSKLEYQLGELDLDDLLSNFSNYTTHELFVKDQLDKSLYFDSRRWQNICICNSKKSTNTIYMSARQAELLSIAKTAYGKDDRVIAFGISEMKTFNIDKRKEKSCAQTIIF